jgi:hypothetical protein
MSIFNTGFFTRAATAVLTGIAFTITFKRYFTMISCGVEMDTKTRFEDRTQWAPFKYIAENDSRPSEMTEAMPINVKRAAIRTTLILHRLMEKES